MAFRAAAWQLAAHWSTRRAVAKHASRGLHAMVVSPRIIVRSMTAASGRFDEPTERMSVGDSTMAYVDSGAPEGNDDNKSQSVVAVFLHGNPTSSFSWRGVIPHVAPVARCLAPDLIGMGRSSKSPGLSYRFVDHAAYLDEWFTKLGLADPDNSTKVVLVVQDWGSGLGFHWARRHPDRVAGIAFMESLTRPLKDWDEFPEGGRKIFQAMRSEAGPMVVLEKNVFAERILPSSMQHKLTPEENDRYQAPFKTPGNDRLPTLQWPREIPIESEGPENVVAITKDYSAWLQSGAGPELLYVHAEPGFFAPQNLEDVKSWPKCRVVKVPGLHFVQEDSPDEIGKAVVEFVQELS